EQHLESRGLGPYTSPTLNDEDPLDLEVEQIEHLISDVRELLARRDYRSVRESVTRLSEEHRIPVDQYGALASGLLRAKVEALETFRCSLLGDYPALGAATSVDTAPARQEEKPAPLLSEAQGQLITAMRAKPKPWVDNTVRKAETTFRLFREFLGDRPVNDYKRSDCHSFYRALALLPKHYGKGAKDRGVTMPQLIDAATGIEGPRLASKSIKGHSSPLGALFEHFRDPDKVNWSNPAYDFDFDRVGAASVARKMWEGEPLRRLFASPVWKGCKSEDRRKEPGDLVIQDHRYWMPILALYHGTRLEELARLIGGEVQEEGGISFLWITDSDEAAQGVTIMRKERVKTDAAVRRVPLHREVLRLGFLDYVAAVAPNPSDFLFPLLKPDPNNANLRSGKFSQWFTDYRRSVGINQEGFAFHSFRHGVATKLNAAGVPDATIIELIGHEGTTTLQTHYIKRGHIPLAALQEAINRIKWPEVVLEPPRAKSGQISATS
ncbi:site-specific integrase, partial [uncultured Nevskia sp.]|uniref:site-specific integrase n=1 Tax=uncultured Nevskia sp. TaxID=228950 RepID=UPI0025E6CA74